MRIKNFNHTGHEPFALDVHTHDGGGGADNITYQHIQMKDSYAPTAKVFTNNQRYAITDLPRDILRRYYNRKPYISWQVNSDGIKIKDSLISNNSNTNNIVLYKNSRDILIQNVTSTKVSDKHYFIVNPPQSADIKNVAIIGNTIIDDSNKSGATMSFSNVTDLTIRENKIIHAPRNTLSILVADSNQP